MTSEHSSFKHNTAAPLLDRVSLILICLILLTPTWGLATAAWVAQLDLLGVTVVVAWTVSIALVSRPWRARTIHTLMLMYGVVWATIVAISFMPDKVYGWTWLDSIRHLLVRLGEHIYLWGEAVATGGVGKDNTIFFLFLTAIFWLITYVAVWSTVRRRSLWWAVAPAGIVLLINMYYYGGPQSLFWILIVYLFGVMLYMARLYTLNQEQRWSLGRVRFEPEIRHDFLMIGAGIAVAVVAFGAIAPNVAGAPQLSDLWREVSRPVRSVEDSFSRLFAGLEPHGIPYANPFGRTLALLGQRNLSDEVVLEVRAPEGQYWQGVIYDVYTGSAFQSSDTDRVIVDANQSPAPLKFEERKFLTQTVTTFFPNSSLVFAASQPVALSQAAAIEVYRETAGSDAAMWSTIDALNSGEQYQVASAISTATTEQLRAAGRTYPEVIRNRYLQLPPSVPLRVRELARQIVKDAQANNAYDEAAALETWLRGNIKYNDQISAPGLRQDGVDYFLFQVKEGYCDYYASAMAVMARAIGLPARVVTGYTEGEFDDKRKVYVVHQYNAHTWTEIYFPNYGWIQFEPTASQPILARPLLAAENAASPNISPNPSDVIPPLNQRDRPERSPEDVEALGSSTSSQASSQRVVSILMTVALAVIGLALLGGSAWIGMRVYEERGVARNLSTGGTWIFARLTRMAHWLRVKLNPAQTPYEQAQAIGQAVPLGSADIERVAALYVQERYGRANADLNEARALWQRLRKPIWLMGLRRRLPHWDFSWQRLKRRQR